MNPTYFIRYVLIIFCCYISELIIFGIWYRIYSKSNISYFGFLKRMLGYCRYILSHLLKAGHTDAPDTSALQWIIALFMPIILPSFILLNDSWIYRIIVFVLPLGIFAEKLFREGRTETALQIDRWVRFLFDAGDRPEGYELSKRRDASEAEEKHLLSKEERRINHILGFMMAGIGIALLIILILGFGSNLKNGFSISPNPFRFFTDTNYNTAFLILLAFELVLALCVIFGTRKDRAEAKDWTVRTVKQHTRKAANYLGLNKGISVDPYLKEWEKSVNRMCRILKIKHVAILSEYSCEENMSGKIALSVRSLEGIPAVILSTREINRQRARYSPQTVHDMVRFLLGHELTHIRYKDYSIWRLIIKELGCLLLTMVILLSGMYLTLQIPEGMENIAAACQIILFAMTLISFRTFCNSRYWRYVSEYRADRISAFISGAADEAITAMLSIDEKKENDGSRQKRKRKSRYHPEQQKRLKELKRKKKWSSSEYFRYAFKLIL